MDLFDLAEAEEYEAAKTRIKSIFNGVDESMKLALCRDLMIDQILMIINKFPAQTQKEMLALIVDHYMNIWDKK